MYKRLTSIFVLMIILICTVNAHAEYDITPTAKAAVLIDASSGVVLYSKNKDERLGPASTTKIMTGILAIEYGNLSDVFTVSPTGEWVEGSSIYLKPGEKITLETLVHGLLLKSGNDAALAIAKHISGSEAAFVGLMNDKVKELGLKNTHFDNPHGLFSETHYTSAYDLAMIAKYAMNNPKFAEIVGLKSYKEIPPENREGRVINNVNKLITLYDEATGVKPGYTPETGRTLVGSAKKDGVSVITVTLDCSDDWKEHKAMFDYAFDNYRQYIVMKKGESVGNFRVKNGNYSEVGIVTTEDVTVLCKRGQKPKYEIKLDPQEMTAPVMENTEIGSADIVFESGEIKSVKLVTNGDVPVREKNYFKIVGMLFLAIFGVSG